MDFLFSVFFFFLGRFAIKVTCIEQIESTIEDQMNDSQRDPQKKRKEKKTKTKKTCCELEIVFPRKHQNVYPLSLEALIIQDPCSKKGFAQLFEALEALSPISNIKNLFTIVLFSLKTNSRLF